MFDTVILYFPYAFSFIENSKHWMLHTGIKYDVPKYKYYTLSINGLHTTIKFKYYPIHRYTGSPLLLVEIGSVPKLVLGNNFEMVTDVAVILKAINDCIHSVPGFEGVDAAKGYLERTDFCFNFKVDDKVSDYLNALSKTSCTSRDVSSYTNRLRLPYTLDKKIKGSQINGVLIGNTSTSLSAYDKYKECLDEKAKGVLRMEKRIRGNSLIGKLIGIPKPKLEDLTPEIATKVLMQELDFLGLSGEFLVEKNVLEQLIQKVGVKEATKLYNHLSLFNLYPGKNAKELSKELGFSLGTIYGWKSELTNSGISLGMSPSVTILPKLTPNFNNEILKNHKKILCDTGEAVTLSTEQKLDNEQPIIQSIDESSVSSVNAAMFSRYSSLFTPNIPPEWLVVSPMQRFEGGLEIRYGDDGSLLIYAGASSRDRPESDWENVFYGAGDLLISTRAALSGSLDTDQNGLQFNVEKPDLSDILMVPQATLGPSVEMSSLVPDRLIWVGSCSKESEVYVKR